MACRQAMASVAQQVRDYIEGRPSIVDAIKMDIVNYSALARLVARELGLRKGDAILAACRRFPVDKVKGYREDAVKRVLRKSRIETRTKVAAITVVQDVDVLQRLGDVVEELLDENRVCRLIQVSQGTVIIVDDESVARVRKKLRERQVVEIRRNLVELAVTSPESIEDTPGLLAFLSAAVASHGINIVHAMSCYTDTIFLLERKDMTAVIDLLSQSLR